MQEADYELGTSQLSDLHTYTGKTADGLTTAQMPKMWPANNAQYYSTIHSLRLISTQAVSDVWLGTEAIRFARRQHYPSSTGSGRYIRGDFLLYITIRYRCIQVSSINLQRGEDTYHRSCFSSAWIPYVQCIPFCRLRERQVNKGKIELGAQVTVSSFLPCEQRPFDLI